MTIKDKRMFFNSSSGYTSGWELESVYKDMPVCDNCKQTAAGISISANEEYWTFVCMTCLQSLMT